MFSGCAKLKELDLSSWNMRNAKLRGYSLLSGCSSLEKINTPINLYCDIRMDYTYVDGKGTVYTSLPMDNTESIVLYKVSK